MEPSPNNPSNNLLNDVAQITTAAQETFNLWAEAVATPNGDYKKARYLFNSLLNQLEAVMHS